MKKEKVLCIKKQNLPATWVEKSSVVPMNPDSFVKHCEKAGFDFVDRESAEKNPDLKQIIPYIILSTKDGNHTAVYNRQGSEKRLHDLWSIGIGGHINPVDSNFIQEADQNSGQNSDQSSGQNKPIPKQAFHKILISGMQRELNEELPENNAHVDSPQFIGIISEDITEVGKVHLGAVFTILTDSPDLYKPGPELFQFSWMETKKLNKLDMELWSVLALELFSQADHDQFII